VSRVRYRLVIKYIGGVLIVQGVSLLLNALVIVLLGEENSSFYVIYGLVIGGAGLSFVRKFPERDINVPEVAAIASLSFLVASLVGAVPYSLYGALSPMDAWFESMSGVTTTGFSLMELHSVPRSILFSRALQQWLGGLGFVLITVSFFIVSGRPAVTLLKEVGEDKVFPRIARHAHAVAIIYIIFTAIGILAFILFGMAFFDAVCYALAGVSTGGFAPYAESAAILSAGRVFLPFMLVMTLGATNFVGYYRVWRSGGGVRGFLTGLLRDPQTRAFIYVTAVFGFIVSATTGGAGRWLEGFFLVASAQSTTGFNLSRMPASLPPGAMMLLIVAMFTGGAVGSTAGGIKMQRVIDLFKGLRGFIVNSIAEKERVLADSIVGTERSKEELVGISYVITVYVLGIFLASLIFALHGYGVVESVFEVTSAAATVGLSAGVVSVKLAPHLKALLVIMMWAGRLEFIPLVVWGCSIRASRR